MPRDKSLLRPSSGARGVKRVKHSLCLILSTINTMDGIQCTTNHDFDKINITFNVYEKAKGISKRKHLKPSDYLKEGVQNIDRSELSSLLQAINTVAEYSIAKNKAQMSIVCHDLIDLISKVETNRSRARTFLSYLSRVELLMKSSLTRLSEKLISLKEIKDSIIESERSYVRKIYSQRYIEKNEGTPPAIVKFRRKGDYGLTFSWWVIDDRESEPKYYHRAGKIDESRTMACGTHGTVFELKNSTEGSGYVMKVQGYKKYQYANILDETYLASEYIPSTTSMVYRGKRKAYISMPALQPLLEDNDLGIRLLSPDRLKWDILLGLAEHLECIQTEGYVHLDVKPENVAYDPVNHRPILIDFGLSMSKYEYYRNPSLRGTPKYLMPVRNKSNDIYLIYGVNGSIVYLSDGECDFPFTSRDIIRDSDLKLQVRSFGAESLDVFALIKMIVLLHVDESRYTRLFKDKDNLQRFLESLGFDSKTVKRMEKLLRDVDDSNLASDNISILLAEQVYKCLEASNTNTNVLTICNVIAAIKSVKDVNIQANALHQDEEPNQKRVASSSGTSSTSITVSMSSAGSTEMSGNGSSPNSSSSPNSRSSPNSSSSPKSSRIPSGSSRSTPSRSKLAGVLGFFYPCCVCESVDEQSSGAVHDQRLKHQLVNYTNI